MNSFSGTVACVLFATMALCSSIRAEEAPAPDNRATTSVSPITIETDKQDYVVGENVRVTFKNTSEWPVTLWLPAGALPDVFTVKRGDGTTPSFAPQGEDACRMGNPYYLVVKPHESSDKVVLLTHWYDMAKPGDYKVACGLSFSTVTNERPRTIEHATSNEVTFRLHDWH